MKTTLRLLLAATIIFSMPSCKKYSKGRLSVSNTSVNTVQRIMIDGTNYGSLDPGNKKEFEFEPGKYTVQLVGISGGTGCSASIVTVVKGETHGVSCSG